MRGEQGERSDARSQRLVCSNEEARQRPTMSLSLSPLRERTRARSLDLGDDRGLALTLSSVGDLCVRRAWKSKRGEGGEEVNKEKKSVLRDNFFFFF